MKRITADEAERLVGTRLDRRRRYATTDDGAPDISMGGAILFSLVTWTVPCSGCHETIDGHEMAGTQYDKNGVVLGAGCHECGYTGKRREIVWLPHELTAPKTNL